MGVCMTEEQKKKLSEKAHQKWSNPETRKIHSEKLKLMHRNMSPGEKERIMVLKSQSMKKYWQLKKQNIV
jgi:ribosomal protein L24